MFICDLPDLQLWRVAMKREAQSLPEGETRDRCRAWLKDLDLEIAVKSLIKASGEKQCAGGSSASQN